MGRPLDIHVNSEIWLYFAMLKKVFHKFTCYVVFINLKKVDKFNHPPAPPPPPHIIDKGKKSPDQK